MKESTEMYGLADYTGHIVIEPKYSRIEYSCMKSGMYYFKAWYEGEEQLIDINGKISDEALPSDGDFLVGENVWSIERDDRGYKIVNEKNEEVGGGYASCTYHDGVVYHEGKNSRNNRESRKGDEIGIYDCIENTDYMIDDAKISDAHMLRGISREEKTLIYGVYTDTQALAAFNYETNEEQRLTDDGRFISVFGNAVIYESNSTYKCVDLQGNNILDDRYFAYAETSAGPLLKRENGEWLCLSEHGEILEASKNFSGTGDAPENYKGHSICTYYEWDGVSCVVVYNDGENQYELYALTK